MPNPGQRSQVRITLADSLGKMGGIIDLYIEWNEIEGYWKNDSSHYPYPSIS